ncbi:methylated-DNA--[protein]-cysteine S-methyltransferase [Phenylobacterium sp.]|uniref:methylated-DNA--[protein]-cysteine S-methyltransferase n=1 Tax=Phenylobacterium sp. TaxID=1871053 RepID=UPI00286D85E3|nr:methylated-DNA--[protein]-cysteine S-methyltransferase [Phenylobacterium sp.]
MTKSLPDTLILDRVETPVGEVLVVVDEAGVLRAFDFADYEPRMRKLMGRHYPGMELIPGRAPDPLRAAVTCYFEGDMGAFDGVAWATNGTDFQRKVWDALCTIPAGETLSYKGLAERIGKPSAMRAVGLANGSNPVAIVVPCHRVIGANGSLTGYGGGLPRKKWLLSHEGAAFKDLVVA